jgi:hypothetical protein
MTEPPGPPGSTGSGLERAGGRAGPGAPRILGRAGLDALARAT